MRARARLQWIRVAGGVRVTKGSKFVTVGLEVLRGFVVAAIIILALLLPPACATACICVGGESGGHRFAVRDFRRRALTASDTRRHVTVRRSRERLCVFHPVDDPHCAGVDSGRRARHRVDPADGHLERQLAVAKHEPLVAIHTVDRSQVRIAICASVAFRSALLLRAQRADHYDAVWIRMLSVRMWHE